LSPIDPRKPIVLLADDDADDRQLAQEALTEVSMAIDLRCVGDGEELLDYLRGRGAYGIGIDAPTPNVILLDLNMPLKGGREVLKDLQADPRFRQIPVIVFTTSSSREDIDSSYALGANSYITKPVTFKGLVDVMRDFSRYWLELVQLPAPVMS
jgi:CheY-like chemotaxis protein